MFTPTTFDSRKFFEFFSFNSECSRLSKVVAVKACQVLQLLSTVLHIFTPIYLANKTYVTDLDFHNQFGEFYTIIFSIIFDIKKHYIVNIIMDSSNESLDYIKCNKDSLKNILRSTFDSNMLDVLNDVIIRTNKIVIHTYNFIKLYALYKFENDQPIPKISKQFVLMIMRIVSKRRDKRGRKGSKKYKHIVDDLQKFFVDHYKQTIIDDHIVYDDKWKSPRSLAYEAIDIVKNIETNIKEHYVEHVFRYINLRFNLEERISEINKKKLPDEETKQLRNEVYREFRKIKSDIFNIENDELTSDEEVSQVDQLE